MKKKIVNILLIGTIIIGLTGCMLSKNITQNNEKMIEDAEILDWEEVYSIINENGAKAEDYENKLYVYTAEVYSIDENFCYLNYNNTIQVELDKETLKSLNKGDVITVVGKLTNLNSTPTLKEAIKLDNKTIKNNFIMAIVETTGLSSRNMKYSNYKVDNKTGLIISYTTSGSSNATHKLKYDNNGNLIEDIKETTLYGTETIKYTYNQDNTVATESYSETNKGETKQGNVWEFTYEKDSKGRIIKKTGINTVSDDHYTMIYTYEYDDNDNVIKETQTSPRSTYIIDYEYDEFNNKIKEISYNVDNPNSKTVIKNTYRIIAKK